MFEVIASEPPEELDNLSGCKLQLTPPVYGHPRPNSGHINRTNSRRNSKITPKSARYRLSAKELEVINKALGE